MTTHHHECKILPFPIPALTGKAADRARILNLYLDGYIDMEKMILWTRQGGHGITDEELADTKRLLRQASAEEGSV
jgi:hypothetical protein